MKLCACTIIKTLDSTKWKAYQSIILSKQKIMDWRLQHTAVVSINFKNSVYKEICKTARDNGFSWLMADSKLVFDHARK